MLQPGPRALEKLAAKTREGRTTALLDEAAREFNARGVAGASLSRIARAVGLTRAALYYVRDRADLAAQAYLRGCEQTRADLAAVSGAADGLTALQDWLRLSLDAERPAQAVLSELDALPEPGRSEVRAAHQANVETLRALIRRGVEDGSIRACDDEVIAQALIGSVAWAQLTEAWVEGDHTAFRAHRADALADLIADGQAVDPATPFHCPVSIEGFFPRAPNAFDREAVAQAKLEQLLMTASQLFNRRGIDGVSLDDIAAELGATKGAVYHYLDNKTDLVVRCYRRAFDIYERISAATGVGRTPLEQSLIGLWLNVQAHTSGLSPLIQMAGAESLPAGPRREIQGRARAIQRRFRAMGDEGVATGVNRDIDIDTLSEIGAGVFQWLPKWFDRDDPRAAGAVADELTRLFTGGLRRR